jgi:hypothetical protein
MKRDASFASGADDSGNCRWDDKSAAIQPNSNPRIEAPHTSRPIREVIVQVGKYNHLRGSFRVLTLRSRVLCAGVLYSFSGRLSQHRAWLWSTGRRRASTVPSRSTGAAEVCVRPQGHSNRVVAYSVLIGQGLEGRSSSAVLTQDGGPIRIARQFAKEAYPRPLPRHREHGTELGWSETPGRCVVRVVPHELNGVT